MNYEDKKLFRKEMKDAVPLKDSVLTNWSKTPLTKPFNNEMEDKHSDNPQVSGCIDIVPLTMPIAFKAEGIQQAFLYYIL
ncbi:Smr/MutS family endonuclease [Erwinia tracheiphila]|nr:Smr/MutS family endonuclease [Erwinia tracheiphila]UIA85420.1 Smr/MutS family endonuclease [Erwinia tracheiphila]UIA93941.1 Smr/MutS family endonuclease [Erwinia tracheiphila]